MAAYPAANTGAEVVQVLPSLAGDAPITAVTARRLGSTTHLISNRVSVDAAGQAVLDVLDSVAVTHQAVPNAAPGSGTHSSPSLPTRQAPERGSPGSATPWNSSPPWT